MKWISMPKRRSNADMTNRQSKEKTVRQIQKEIEKLRAEHQKTEFRPCHGDLDLFQKDKDLDLLKEEINALERERDAHLYT
jgi:superfamily II RNA helicase